MRALLADLVTGAQPVDAARWRGFWVRLRDGRVSRPTALAVAAALSARIPDAATVNGLVVSLRERTQAPDVYGPEAVGIAGTGGGPATFNISTAAALVAAAGGTRVVKTGSHAYTSRHGSFDLLDRLGVRRAGSHEEAARSLDRFGIAFADYFVYPPDLRRLATACLPHDMRDIGRLFNTLGPFLASVPGGTRIVGVADPRWYDALSELAELWDGPPAWLAANDLGMDELVGFTDNRLRRGAGRAEVKLAPAALGLGAGTAADLAPVDDGRLVAHFRAVLAGRGPAAATETVALNAAALAIASTSTADGNAADWAVADWIGAVAAALDTLARGDAVRLLDRIKEAA